MAVTFWFRASSPVARSAASLLAVFFAKLLTAFEDDMPMTMLYNPVTGYGLKKGIEWTPYSQYYMDFRPSNFSLAAK